MDKQEMTDRHSAEYRTKLGIERMTANRAIRLKCAECMGGERGRMPRGETAEWIDECSSTCCPLWPFRYGSNPWRAPVSDAQREASKRAGRRLSAMQPGKSEKAIAVDAQRSPQRTDCRGDGGNARCCCRLLLNASETFHEIHPSALRRRLLTEFL